MSTPFVNQPSIICATFPVLGSFHPRRPPRSSSMLLCHLNLTTVTLLCIIVPIYVVKKFQPVQNAAARLRTCSRKYDHILIKLHWLPVSERIKFKILLLTFKALHQLSSTYIQDFITRYSPSRTLGHLLHYV